MNPINLKWTNLANIEYLSTETKKPGYLIGIYLWGFILNDKFVPYYIGYSDDIIWRLNEHIANLLGGKYPIFNKKILHKFFDFIPPYKDENYKKPNEIMYLPERRLQIADFAMEMTMIRTHIYYMVNNFCYTYAIVKNVEIWDTTNKILMNEINESKRISKAAEKYVIEKIGKDKLINYKGGNWKPYVFRSQISDKLLMDLRKLLNT